MATDGPPHSEKILGLGWLILFNFITKGEKDGEENNLDSAKLFVP